ncbi:HET domain-containing protein [Microdochium nivale]|nr:HET domain-containing protein [Microdochium nivale]
MIRDALNHCRTSHALCGYDQSNDMPTRVVAILGWDDGCARLKLVNPYDDGVHGKPYIALSYCWGPPAPTLRLARETIQTMSSGFLGSALSKTHRDAIHLAGALGVEYVWIDALCIIQGDAEDWTRESRLMATVYGNAALTIIAGRSADASLGFLTPPRLIRSQPPRPAHCSLPLTHMSDDLVHVCMSRNLDVGPTSTRGWCFQEGLLSRQAIIFGQAQISFQCLFSTVFEDGRQWPTGPMGRLRLFMQPNNAGHPQLVHKVLGAWYVILNDFTKRHLSNPTDIFASLAALATQFGIVLGTRYLAGLWEQDLIRGLLWIPRYHSRLVSYSGTVTRPVPTSFTPGPTVIRAPSWSWAAVQGAVFNKSVGDPQLSRRYRATDDDFVKVKPALTLHDGGRSWTSDTQCGVSTLHMPSCRLHMLGRLRQVRVGEQDSKKKELRIKLRGSGRRLLWTRPLMSNLTATERDDDCGAAEPPANHGNDIPVSWIAFGWIDVPQEFCSQAWCLQLTPEEGLLLIQDVSGVEDNFRRVGLFRLLRLDWFDDTPEREVYLI